MGLRIVLITILIGVVLVSVSGPGSAGSFVTIENDQFVHNGEVIRIKGSNYYPRDHMWADIWNSWDWNRMVADADMMRDLGLNCVRILVPYSHGGWNGPNVPADRLQKLEDLVNMFGARGIRSCVTLFDWETSFAAAGSPGEAAHLLYLNTIVGRLKNNVNVLMWDVKNEPDHPSNLGGGLDNWNNSINKSRIIDWLRRMCNAVRAIDPNHPVSVGLRWWENNKDIIDFVDVAIFHSYWPNVHQQIVETQSYMGANIKPILCEEFGWPTNPTPCDRDGVLIYDYTEDRQLYLYTLHLTEFEEHNIAGCIQWMTFDARNYTTNAKESFEKFFGLWRYDYTLKPAGAYYRDHFLTRPFIDASPGQNVGQLKTLAAGSSVQLSGKIVSGVFPLDGCIYIQDPDRAGGLRVSTSQTGLAVGDVVAITGTMADRMLSGKIAERQINATSVFRMAAGRDIAPVAMSCAAVGGGRAGSMVPGVKDGAGLNNIGLLVRICGRVTYKAGVYIYVDDGSNIENLYSLNTPVTGVMVKCPSSPNVDVGDMVGVTGIVQGSIPVNWTENRRFIQARTLTDIVRM